MCVGSLSILILTCALCQHFVMDLIWKLDSIQIVHSLHCQAASVSEPSRILCPSVWIRTRKLPHGHKLAGANTITRTLASKQTSLHLLNAANNYILPCAATVVIRLAHTSDQYPYHHLHPNSLPKSPRPVFGLKHSQFLCPTLHTMPLSCLLTQESHQGYARSSDEDSPVVRRQDRPKL